MPPPMYALVEGTPFHFNIAPATEVADFPPMYAADGVTLIPYKREETVSINAKSNKPRSTMIRGKTYSAQCMIHLICTSTTHSKSRLQQRRAQLGGLVRCLSMTSLTNLCQRTANQLRTQCVRTTSTSWRGKIHRSLLRSSSNAALIARKLQSLQRCPTQRSRCL